MTSSTFFEKEDLVVRLVELLVSVSDVDLKLGIGRQDENENSHPLVPSGGKRTGSLYFTSEKDVSTPSPSVPILNAMSGNPNPSKNIQKWRK